MFNRFTFDKLADAIDALTRELASNKITKQDLLESEHRILEALKTSRDRDLRAISSELKQSGDALRSAVEIAQGQIRPNLSFGRQPEQQETPTERSSMAKEVLEQLRAQVAKNTEVEGSAAVLISGIAARIKTAVDAAIANGATAEELAPVTDEIAALNASGSALANAVAANT
jgi:hypothetical protein